MLALSFPPHSRVYTWDYKKLAMKCMRRCEGYKEVINWQTSINNIPHQNMLCSLLSVGKDSLNPQFSTLANGAPNVTPLNMFLSDEEI